MPRWKLLFFHGPGGLVMRDPAAVRNQEYDLTGVSYLRRTLGGAFALLCQKCGSKSDNTECRLHG